MDTLLGDFTAYHKISYTNKKANDFKWIEDNVGFIRSHFSHYDHKAFQEKLDINYNLGKGRGDSAMKHYASSDLNLQDKGIFSESSNIKHYDIIRRILTRMWGEQQKRRLKFIARDTSGYNVNIRKKKRLELYQDYIQQTVVSPIQQQVTQEVFMQYGIQDPKQLSPEEQEQISSEIDQKMRFKTPSDIEKFMRKDYKSSSESQLQKLAEWLTNEYNLKFMFDEAYKDLTLAGFNCIETDIRNGYPYCKIINPKNFEWFNPSSSPFIEDGEWWSAEDNVAYSHFVNNMVSSSKELKKLKDHIYSPNTDAYRRQIRGEAPEHIVRALANEVVAPTASIDPKTGNIDYGLPDASSPEGQNFYKMLLNKFGTNSKHQANTIRTCRTVFSSLCEVHFVEREDKYNPGKLKGFWVGENYQTNPDIDVRVTSTWARELYEGTEIGYTGDYFINKRRVPFQNRSLNDPFTVYSPFIGVEFCKLHDNAERIAPVDLGKVYNYEYNIVKNKLEELQETDIGKVFVFPESALPDNWDLGTFLGAMKKGKLAVVNTSGESYNPGLDNNIFKGIDLSNNQDIAAKIQQLEYIAKECQEAMSYSPSQMGQAPASMTATNNQQNIVQGSYATEDLNSLQRKFEENFLNHFTNLTRNALRDNEHLRTYLLNDMDIAELELSPETLHLSDIAIKIINDTEEVQEILSFKNLLQPMIQNGLITTSEAIRIQFSKSPVDLINLAEEAEERHRKMQEEAAKREDQASQQMMELERERLLQEYNLKILELENKMVGYQLQSVQFQMGADADQNKVPDTVQTANISKESQLEIANLKAQNDIKIQELKNQIKERELRVQKEIAAMKPAPKKA